MTILSNIRTSIVFWNIAPGRRWKKVRLRNTEHRWFTDCCWDYSHFLAAAMFMMSNSVTNNHKRRSSNIRWVTYSETWCSPVQHLTRCDHLWTPNKSWTSRKRQVVANRQANVRHDKTNLSNASMSCKLSRSSCKVRHYHADEASIILCWHSFSSTNAGFTTRLAMSTTLTHTSLSWYCASYNLIVHDKKNSIK